MPKPSRTTLSDADIELMYFGLKQLQNAARNAANAMCDSINLELGAGNDEFADAKHLCEALDEIDHAVRIADVALKSCCLDEPDQ